MYAAPLQGAKNGVGLCVSSQHWYFLTQRRIGVYLREVETIVSTKRVSAGVLSIVILLVISIASKWSLSGLRTGHEFIVRRFLLHPVMTLFVAWQAQVIASENPFLYFLVSKNAS